MKMHVTKNIILRKEPRCGILNMYSFNYLQNLSDKKL